MKVSEIKEMLAETGFPVTYGAWEEQGVPELPYIVWDLPGSENFGADDGVYKEVETLRVELYAMRRSFAAEKRVEAVLDAYCIFWDKTSVWIDAEDMNQTSYTMDIFIEEENNGE